MSITNLQVNQMYEWITGKMLKHLWYPVKTDTAKVIIIELFDENLIQDCELNSNHTAIRRVELNYEKQSLYGKSESSDVEIENSSIN